MALVFLYFIMLHASLIKLKTIEDQILRNFCSSLHNYINTLIIYQKRFQIFVLQNPILYKLITV